MLPGHASPLSYQHTFWSVWKKASKIAYCPELTAMTGTLTAGVLLSQILYWFGPTSKGVTRLRVFKEGRYCLAKSREEWREETGLSFKQIKHAQDRLVELGIIKVKLFRFNGLVNQHIFLNQDVLLKRLADLREAELNSSTQTLEKQIAAEMAELKT